ncbi:MAG: hypothetical protein JWN48_3979 [Myxococcaceae bacterium]|nr:hypothetical protein [Myxococcaceae bacterium]
MGPQPYRRGAWQNRLGFAVSNARNYGLDGLRGAAALVVVCHHFQKVGCELTSAGHLAVDFFFALSGYVIARAYEPRLRVGGGFWAFTRERIVRLYPMYALGAALGLLQHLITGALGDPEALPLRQSVRAFGLSLLMLPSYATGSRILELFPLNGPSWSLFFELLINFAFAAVFFRLRSVVLLALVAVTGAWFCKWGVGTGTVNWGWGWTSWDAGVARVGYSFLLGVLLARWTANTPTRQSWLAVLSFPIMVAALVLPTFQGPGRELLFACVFSPAILWFGSRYDVPTRARRCCKFLGDISYPLYAVHFPVILLCVYVARRAGLRDAVTIPSVIAGLVALSYGLGAKVDPLLRQSMRGWLQGPARQLSSERARARS